MPILVVEDKLGITEGYKATWEAMCLKAGLNTTHMRKVSLWRSPLRNRGLLIQKGNRKSPGFNPDIRMQVRSWLVDEINRAKATHVLIMDLAVLGVVEPNWSIATIDLLRGGVYHLRGPDLHSESSVRCLVTVPISAVNTQKKPKDIRAMNQGAETREEWEESQGDGDDEDEELYMEPYTIPYGKWVLRSDLLKLSRIVQKG